MAAYAAIALGTLFGGWRIIHTMGSRITKLQPVNGFAAETGAAIAVGIATHFGIPVSTTHAITGSIVGRRFHAAMVRGAVGRGRADRLGLGRHDPGGRRHRRRHLRRVTAVQDRLARTPANPFAKHGINTREMAV